MEGIRISKRAALVLGVVCALTLCGTAVAFFYIGAYNDACDYCRIIETNVIHNQHLTSSGTDSVSEDGRLPRHIEPILYKIELFPNIYGADSSEFSFNGSVWLRFNCTKRSNNITLSVNRLNLTESSMHVGFFGSQAGQAIQIARYEINEKWQFLIIYLREFLTPGVEYCVTMEFTGRLQTDFAGMYLSTFPYRTRNQYVAATQFSPTDARKAFPCLDEPDRKAQFEITIVRRQDMVSLSNMPLHCTHQRGLNFVADVYQRTPKMSTYLLAMAVGDLSSVTRPARNGLNYTSWAGRENIDKTEHALGFGAKVLSFFENYFGITFPLPKQDILAVPETSVGAMENWGLIIFNQNRIFYKEGEYSLYNLMYSTITISHELTHQWFGNLVTMDWWSDLFLKEGFAVYFADIGIADVYPEWNFLNHFAVRNMHSVFSEDGLISSHPVYKKLSDTTEIRQVFDSISYTKGGCMIRMLNFILGDTDFQAGLKSYLQQFAYDSVGHNDLWKAVEPNPLTYYHPPGVKQVMDTWILQKNYPVLTIRQIRPGVLRVTQERFLNNPSAAENDTEVSPFNYIWKIPLTYTTNRNTSFSVTHKDIIWIEDKDVRIIDRQLQDLSLPGNWIIANLKQWGYYRVNYDENIWQSLIQQLKENKLKIDLVNRAQIINDLFSLSKVKMVPLKTSLSTLEYLRDEDEYVPWLAATREISYINGLIPYIPSYEKFKEIIISFFHTIFRNLEINKHALTMEQNLLRATIFSHACNFEMPLCIEQSEKDFRLWRREGIPLDPNTRETILCSALKKGSEADWNYVLQKYNTTLNVNEKYAYLSALACTKNENLHYRLLNLTMDTSTIQSRDIGTTLSSLALNSAAIDKVWEHLKNNWARFMDTFAGSLFLLSNLVDGVTRPFTTKKQLTELEDFIAVTSDLGPAEQTFNQSVESTKANILWLAEHQATVEDWIIEMTSKYRL